MWFLLCIMFCSAVAIIFKIKSTSLIVDCHINKIPEIKFPSNNNDYPLPVPLCSCSLPVCVADEESVDWQKDDGTKGGADAEGANRKAGPRRQLSRSASQKSRQNMLPLYKLQKYCVYTLCEHDEVGGVAGIILLLRLTINMI